MHNFLGKKLLFIVAHPDDESFLAAGTVHQNHLAGGKNYIICATFGEQGRAHLTKPASTKQLAQIRKQELIKVSKFLKIDGLYFLNLPDTKVKENKNIFKNKAEKIIQKIKPEFIFGFGPDGISGHMDHIAAGEVSKKLAGKNKIPYLTFGASPEFIKNFKLTIKRRAHGKYGKNITHTKPNIKIQINYKVKHKAFSFHKSQFGSKTLLQDFPKKIKDSLMSFEYFINNK
jgi:LmbE family N-acetylglucosaminyl deacetylase